MHGCPEIFRGLLQHFRDLRFAIYDEGLIQQNLLFVEFAHAAFDHLFDDIGRLTALARLIGVNRTLARDDIGRQRIDTER